MGLLQDLADGLIVLRVLHKVLKPIPIIRRELVHATLVFPAFGQCTSENWLDLLQLLDGSLMRFFLRYFKFVENRWMLVIRFMLVLKVDLTDFNIKL